MTIQSKIKKLIKERKGVAKIVPDSKPKEREIPGHQHVWKVIGKTYAPPTNLNLSSNQMSERSIERAMFGLTTLLWECTCGETKREELLGSDEDLLESVINKADKIGPQFVERNGKSYIISEWKPQIKNPETIPVR